MMSEEEINRKIQDFVDKIEQIVSTNIHLLKDNEILKINNIDETTLTDFVSFCLEIKNLYIKEKEKNTNLELCLKSEEKYSEGLNRDIKSLLNIEPNNNFISKDKIREKIKELEKEYNKYTGYKGLEFSRTGLISSQIQVLKELLGE